MPESLINPPTEFREEAHPGISTNEMHDVTEKVAERVRSSDREDSSPERERKGRAHKSTSGRIPDRSVEEDHKQKTETPSKSEDEATAPPTKTPSTLPSDGNGKNVL